MIKGVSRYAVEIDKTNSPFFERVICFVRPQYAEGNALDLHREAVRVVDNLTSGVEEAQSGSRHILKAPPRRPNANPARCVPSKQANAQRPASVLERWLPMLLSAGGGAAAAMLLSAIF